MNTRYSPIARFCVCAALFSCVSTAFAAPSITAISGELRHGASLTITGTDFGSKTTAAPIYWADFENGIQPTNLGQKTTWDWINRDMELSSALTRANSSQAARWNAGSDYQGGSDTGGVALLGTAYPQLYIYVKRHYAYETTNYNMNHKVWRLWSDDWSNNIYTGMQGGSDGRTIPERTGTRADWHASPVIPFEWMTQELLYRAGSVGGNDGIFWYYRNGVPVTTRSDHRMRTSEYSNLYSRFYLQDDISNETQPRAGLWIYYDDIYIDNTWARVMLGNAPTFAQSDLREIQIPSAWSDNSITITLNQGELGNLNGAFLYVIDAEGNANSRGFPLCPTCPSPPRDAR